MATLYGYKISADKKMQKSVHVVMKLIIAFLVGLWPIFNQISVICAPKDFNA